MSTYNYCKKYCVPNPNLGIKSYKMSKCYTAMIHGLMAIMSSVFPSVYLILGRDIDIHWMTLISILLVYIAYLLLFTRKKWNFITTSSFKL